MFRVPWQKKGGCGSEKSPGASTLIDYLADYGNHSIQFIVK